MPKGLVDWVGRETKLGNPALEKADRRDGRRGFEKSVGLVDGREQIDCRDGPRRAALPLRAGCLERFTGRADMIVCSQTPYAALEAEWEEHDLAKYVVAICGQEVGSKKEALASAKQYPPNHTLMIGDAPGDYKAAVANDCLFFPINPGAEETSWRRLHDEGIARFFEGTFAGAYQEQLLEEFDTFLPERPPWKVED